ncbi:GNAT family N-acetyltransferase [Micromonospora eburnea]|uniref:Acetyltransferase (GNAT) domain-containing protein n=1 Tax=Micromonospora eburnea TaxID=227316 RepID=A0A1C6UXT5_9ACTN|nr:GNAT family N-acetyltransferase [Micromonospora eburnea]SCL58619.1 Acetyltransferase (GNAT) domain-containing protein [Micromonospora eburnea]
MPTTQTVAIRRATPPDAAALVRVLVDAFFDGPVADWLIPGLAERRVVYHRYFRLMLDHGLRQGRVDTTTDLTGVAIWYRREDVIPAGPDLHDELEKACGEYAPKFLLLDALFAAHHPRVPHDYLAYLAVDPAAQGRGVGSALLNHAHRTLDARNEPAYLEASNEHNRRLYLRHGYQSGPPVQASTGAPPIWPMWREAADGGAQGPDGRLR